MEKSSKEIVFFRFYYGLSWVNLPDKYEAVSSFRSFAVETHIFTPWAVYFFSFNCISMQLNVSCDDSFFSFSCFLSFREIHFMTTNFMLIVLFL